MDYLGSVRVWSMSVEGPVISVSMHMIRRGRKTIINGEKEKCESEKSTNVAINNIAISRLNKSSWKWSGMGGTVFATPVFHTWSNLSHK